MPTRRGTRKVPDDKNETPSSKARRSLSSKGGRKPQREALKSGEFQIAEETVGFLLWDTARRFKRVFSECLSRHGISFGLWPVLRTLSDEDGLTQAELAARLQLVGPTVVDIIAELERRKLITRSPSPSDRRKTHVNLTKAGREIVELVMPDVAAENRAGLSDFSAEEQALLKKFLRRLRANIDKF
jgi:DNA-binding MarR family transcriptional regulator